MGVIHGLECNARVIAVEVAVLHQILDGIDDLFERQSALGIKGGLGIGRLDLPSSGGWLVLGVLQALPKVSAVFQ